MRFWNWIGTKTWSREFAFLMWIGLALITWHDDTEALNVFIWPVTIFTLAAFGFRQPAVSSWMQRSGGNGGFSRVGWSDPGRGSTGRQEQYQYYRADLHQREPYSPFPSQSDNSRQLRDDELI